MSRPSRPHESIIARRPARNHPPSFLALLRVAGLAGLAALAPIGGTGAAADSMIPGAPPAVSATDPIADAIAVAAARFGIPVGWLQAVVGIESADDPRAVSPKGAMGLMQLMPETWAALRSRYGLGADPFDAGDNVTAGTAYLRELVDRYGMPGCFAAYQAGPARFEEYLAAGRSLPDETTAYLARLAPLLGGDQHAVEALAASWRTASLFAGHAGGPSMLGSGTASVVEQRGLFVQLGSAVERRP
jgi:soluble lytic murein transglycosylase-like protein